MNRGWDTGELNRVWISDITYLRTGEGWLYLCVVRDGCSRRVLFCRSAGAVKMEPPTGGTILTAPSTGTPSTAEEPKNATPRA